jgi:hypothetical protein
MTKIGALKKRENLKNRNNSTTLDTKKLELYL